jgi:type II secretory pathway pseudopilin PulG
MKTRLSRPAHRMAFSVLEMLVAVTILSLIVVVLAVLIDGISRTWIESEKRLEVFQSGRAILDLMGRELAGAQISPQLHFVLSPPLIPSSSAQAPNSSSLFWQASLASTSKGSLCIVGYFLMRDDANGIYQLRRLFISPDDNRGYYKIFDPVPPDDVQNRRVPWLDDLPAAAFTNPGEQSSAVSVVSDGVVGLWIRGRDHNGDIIPWNGEDKIKFNSAGRFQSSIPGQPNSFRWNHSSTLPKNELPASVEITIIVVDSQTLAKKFPIPTIISARSASDIPRVIETFQQQLLANEIKSACTFSTRINLINAVR